MCRQKMTGRGGDKMRRFCLLVCWFVGLLVIGCSEPATSQPILPPTIQPTNSPTIQSTSPANADVIFVRAVKNNNTYTFHVTVAHPDTGWEDYADGWDVVLPDGTVVKANPDDPFTRLLLHPHETEQPFTRAQSGLTIPDGITQLTVRAHDLVDGFGGQEVVVDLTVAEGENFVVEGE
jgi:hypothetical protein